MAKVTELSWKDEWELDYTEVGEVATRFKEGVDSLIKLRNACLREGEGILSHVNCGKVLGKAVVGYFGYLRDAHGTAGGCIAVLKKAYGTMLVAGQANGDSFPSIIDTYNPMDMDSSFKLGNKVNAADIQWIINEIGNGKSTAAIDEAVTAIQSISSATCITMPEDGKKVLKDICTALTEMAEGMRLVRHNLSNSATAIKGELAAATQSLNAHDAILNKALDTETDKSRAMHSTTASTKN